ncbi:PP-loop family [Musa troglodytarum]|uniref:PP-loop family n=1 Tax=Musa troglodytarum TaxID=320322 RepID=A0A9E7H1P7_9LILI|nr:PP-loop family [Musa troglodytarum]
MLDPTDFFACLAALGVADGPDSVALCVLTAGWKLDGSVAKNESSGFVDGLLGIVVDRRLRAEGTEQAILVRDRVNKMGVKCEIEAAREMREGTKSLRMFASSNTLESFSLHTMQMTRSEFTFEYWKLRLT